MGLRLTAVIPLIASAITVALNIVLLSSGTSTANANGNFWLAINTTGIGTGLIQITAANDTDTGGLGGLINSIPGLDSIIDNITNSIGSSIEDLQGELLGSVVSGLGIQEYYALYTTNLCQGNFTSRAADASAKISACYSYNDEGAGLLNSTNSIPSQFVVGTAQVSVPLVDVLKRGLTTIINLGTGSATALMVFLIISTVSQGLVALGSLLGIFRSQSRLITDASLIFAALATLVLLLIALIMSLIVGIATSILGDFGEGLSLHIKGGGIFLAILWVSTVLSIVASLFWFVVWFVEFRKSSFSRRSRTPDQIGAYSQIIAEVKKDLKKDAWFPAAGTTGGPTGGLTGAATGAQYDKSERGVMGVY